MTVFCIVHKLCLTCKNICVIIWTIKWRDYVYACVWDMWVPRRAEALIPWSTPVLFALGH